MIFTVIIGLLLIFERHKMKHIIAMAGGLLALTLRAEDIELFVFGGQSNMQGCQGDAANYPADPQGLDKKVRFYWVTPGASSSTGQWTQLQPQGGRFPKGHFGPEVTFARSLASNGVNAAVFKYSLGSTSLAENWKAPGAQGMYDKMLAELQKAVKILRDQGHTVTIKAFVWVQGESDAKNKGIASGYQQRLQLLIADFRKQAANDPALTVILGVDEQHPWVKACPQVVAAQQELAKSGTNIVATSMVGLEKADSTHLTPKGLAAHGLRLFDAYWKKAARAAAP
jgi:hypothetical protein